MKRILFLLILILLLISVLAVAMDSVESPKNCKQCGMDRTMFARSRMLILYADGVAVGVCSIHCAAAELRYNTVKSVGSLMVADYSTKKLIDARKAVWVVGGSKKGVMTAHAKWAFEGAEDARKFVEENGGTVNSFDRAMNAATMEVAEQAAEERDVEREILRELK